MSALFQRLKSIASGVRGRAGVVVAVVALASALGIALASRNGGPLAGPATVVEAAAKAASAVPVEAGLERPGMDVDAFTALEQRLAEERRRRAQDMLDRVYPDRAFVTVGVELDPRWERTTEKVQPEWPAVVEDERPDGDTGGSRRRILEPFAGTRDIGLFAPEVRRVSVALVLDESIAASPTRRADIVAAVAKAVGPVRGADPDVEVLVDRFPDADAAAAAAAPSSVAAEIGVAGWAALIALSALLLAFSRIRRARLRAAIPVPVVEPVEETEELRKGIERAIERDPDVVTRVVEGWLSEIRS